MRTDALDFTDVQLRKPALPRARAHTHRHTNTNSISWRKRSGPLGCLQPHLHGWTRDYHNKHPSEEDGKSMMDARQGWWLGGELSRILFGLASVAFALPPSCPSDTWNHGHTNTHARLRRFLVPCFVLTVPALTDANHSYANTQAMEGCAQQCERPPRSGSKQSSARIPPSPQR